MRYRQRRNHGIACTLQVVVLHLSCSLRPQPLPGGGCTHYQAWPWSYDRRPSHPYNAETEHVGCSPISQASDVTMNKTVLFRLLAYLLCLQLNLLRGLCMLRIACTFSAFERTEGSTTRRTFSEFRQRLQNCTYRRLFRSAVLGM